MDNSLSPQRSASPRAFQPYQRSSSHVTSPAMESEPITASFTNSVGLSSHSGTDSHIPVTGIESSKIEQMDPRHSVHKSVPNGEASKFKATYDGEEDEEDVVTRVMMPGTSSQPLVNSIREELQKLAERTSGQNPNMNGK